MLVVWGEAIDPPPPLHGVQGLATSDQEVVGGYLEGPRVEAPEGSIWQVAVEGKVYSGGFGFSGKHQGRVYQH